MSYFILRVLKTKFWFPIKIAIFNTNEKDRQYFKNRSLGNADAMFYQNHQAVVTMRKEYEKKQLSNVTVSTLVIMTVKGNKTLVAKCGCCLKYINFQWTQPWLFRSCLATLHCYIKHLRDVIKRPQTMINPSLKNMLIPCIGNLVCLTSWLQITGFSKNTITSKHRTFHSGKRKQISLICYILSNCQKHGRYMFKQRNYYGAKETKFCVFSKSQLAF